MPMSAHTATTESVKAEIKKIETDHNKVQPLSSINNLPCHRGSTGATQFDSSMKTEK